MYWAVGIDLGWGRGAGKDRGTCSVVWCLGIGAAQGAGGGVRCCSVVGENGWMVVGCGGLLSFQGAVPLSPLAFRFLLVFGKLGAGVVRGKPASCIGFWRGPWWVCRMEGLCVLGIAAVSVRWAQWVVPGAPSRASILLNYPYTDPRT